MVVIRDRSNYSSDFFTYGLGSYISQCGAIVATSVDTASLPCSSLRQRTSDVLTGNSKRRSPWSQPLPNLPIPIPPVDIVYINPFDL